MLQWLRKHALGQNEYPQFAKQCWAKYGEVSLFEAGTANESSYRVGASWLVRLSRDGSASRHL
jgi:hypothetical protein